MRCHNLARRIDDQPEDSGRGEGPDQDAPAVVAGEDAVSANVVEREGERRQHRGDEAVGIEAERRHRLAADDANRQRYPGHRDQNRGDFLRRELLVPASYHVDQHPHRRRVLQNDCDGDAGPLDGDVIEVIRRRDTQHAEDQALNEIGRGELDALPSATSHKHRQQHQQRK